MRGWGGRKAEKGGKQVQGSASISELASIPQENIALCYIMEDIWTGPVPCTLDHFIEGRKGRSLPHPLSCCVHKREPVQSEECGEQEEERTREVRTALAADQIQVPARHPHPPIFSC